MDRTERLRLVNGAIALIDTTEGWDWVRLPVKDVLKRMAENVDAPPSERERLSKGLRRLVTGDPSFRTDPLAVDLMRVATDFAA